MAICGIASNSLTFCYCLIKLCNCVNNQFKILEEKTFSYSKGELYIMLMQEGNRYGVEVTDRTKTLGRKFTRSKKSAELLYNILSKRLSSYNKLVDAEIAAKHCLSLTHIDKMIFAALACGGTLGQKHIVYLKNKIEFKTKIKFGYHLNFPTKGGITVFIYLWEKEHLFAVLTGSDDAKKLKFEIINR